MPNFSEYNYNNWLAITGSCAFLLISNYVLKQEKLSIAGKNVLTVVFCCFLLTTTFAVSYIYSMHNPKNTLTVFLIGIIAVSLFFALEVKQLIVVSIYVLLLFLLSTAIPGMSFPNKVANLIAAFIIIIALYSFSRYSYYYKSEHFNKLKQLEEKNLEIQLLNHQKSEILSFVAHDLRNPLNNIEALSRLVLEEDNGQEHTEMQLILTSTRQAKHIIDDLLEIAQHKKTPFQLQTTNMIEFMDSVCSNWQKNLHNERRIIFDSDEENLTAAVNISKLTRALDNLIANGLKFSKAEMPVNIHVSRTETGCVIRITDFGIGIPQELQDLLFDQFSKAGRPGLKGEKSIGLGLHISKQIIEQHGGSLTVRSKENEGSTFEIVLPFIAA